MEKQQQLAFRPTERTAKEKANRQTAEATPPLISIITITYNDALGLERTIQSVASQEYVASEFIVIDGCSTDATPEILDRHAPTIDKRLSEPDHGISDAFNKGLTLATGRYIIFLNAGDVFASDETLQDVRPYLVDAGHDCVIGVIAYTQGPGKLGPTVKAPKAIHTQLLRNYWPHQAMFIRRDLYSTIGGYRTDFHLGMDYEWSLRLLYSAKRRNIRHIPNVIAHMAWGGRSMSNYRQTFLTYHRARKIHLKQISAISLIVSYFFIMKRALGNSLRGQNGR